MTFRAQPRPQRKQREADEFASYVAPRPAARMVVSVLAAPAVPKNAPHYSESWRRAVAALPYCVLCGSNSGNQAAHRNEGKGMAQKVDDCLTAALCIACHTAIDQGKEFTRDERRATIDRAIVLTLVQLFRGGLVRVA